eukprot:314041_1
MISTCLKRKRSKYPLIWTSTYVNTSNLNKVYLFVPRNNGRGTTKHSVKPIDFLQKLEKHFGRNWNDTINVPSKCPILDKQQLKQCYNLNEDQCQQAADTIKSLWTVVQSDLRKSGQKKYSESEQSLSTSTAFRNTNTNQIIQYHQYICHFCVHLSFFCSFTI